MTALVTKPIFVTAVRFTKTFETIPRRIEFDGVSYDLLPDYKKVAERDNEAVFDVSDGTYWFKLRQAVDSSSWQLLKRIPRGSA